MITEDGAQTHFRNPVSTVAYLADKQPANQSQHSSPYARKVRIALLEKAIPFELLTEVPWDRTTNTPQYNPLEKLPVLIDTEAKEAEDSAVYESHFILDWIECKFAPPRYISLMPDSKEGELFAKKVQGL